MLEKFAGSAEQAGPSEVVVILVTVLTPEQPVVGVPQTCVVAEDVCVPLMIVVIKSVQEENVVIAQSLVVLVVEAVVPVGSGPCPVIVGSVGFGGEPVPALGNGIGPFGGGQGDPTSPKGSVSRSPPHRNGMRQKMLTLGGSQRTSAQPQSHQSISMS